MKEFRQTLELLLPNVNYQEEWQGETCFNLEFISKAIIIMKRFDLNVSDEDLDTFARMPIDVMIEERPDLLRSVLTAIRKGLILVKENNAPIPTTENAEGTENK